MTYGDRNPMKRWLQARRLDDAMILIPPEARHIVDFGGGDGELIVRLKAQRPAVEAICFEPTPFFAWEAERKLRDLQGVSLTDKEAAVPTGWADAVVCAEVFEHLPDAAIDAALDEIARMLKPGGVLVLGVPVEVGPPALVKGLFRFLRRPGAPDADLCKIARAVLRRPHGPRSTVQIAPERPYHPHHLGFDHRPMLARLAGRFEVHARRGSPWASAPPLLNSEIYLLARRL